MDKIKKPCSQTDKQRLFCILHIEQGILVICTKNAHTYNYNISFLPEAGNRHLSQLSVQIFYLVYHRKYVQNTQRID